MLPAQSKSDFFLILVSIAFIVVTGTSLLIAVKRPVDKTIFVGNASEATTTEPGKTEVAGEVIYDFPSFPQYPSSEVVDSYRKEEAELVGYSAKWLAKDTVGDIASWYQDRLQELGWSILIPPEPDIDLTEKFLQAQLGDLTVNITIEAEVGLTNIEVDFPVQPKDSYLE